LVIFGKVLSLQPITQQYSMLVLIPIVFHVMFHRSPRQEPTTAAEQQNVLPPKYLDFKACAVLDFCRIDVKSVAFPSICAIFFYFYKLYL